MDADPKTHWLCKLKRTMCQHTGSHMAILFLLLVLTKKIKEKSYVGEGGEDGEENGPSPPARALFFFFNTFGFFVDRI